MDILSATSTASKVAPIKLKVQFPDSSSEDIILRIFTKLNNLEAFSCPSVRITTTTVVGSLLL